MALGVCLRLPLRVGSKRVAAAPLLADGNRDGKRRFAVNFNVFRDSCLENHFPVRSWTEKKRYAGNRQKRVGGWRVKIQESCTIWKKNESWVRKITNTKVGLRKIGSNVDFRGYVWFRNRITEIPQAGNQVYVQNIAALVHADEEMWLMQIPKGYASRIFISVTISCDDLHYLCIPFPDYPWIQEVRICI